MISVTHESVIAGETIYYMFSRRSWRLWECAFGAKSTTKWKSRFLVWISSKSWEAFGNRKLTDRRKSPTEESDWSCPKESKECWERYFPGVMMMDEELRIDYDDDWWWSWWYVWWWMMLMKMTMMMMNDDDDDDDDDDDEWWGWWWWWGL